MTSPLPHSKFPPSSRIPRKVSGAPDENMSFLLFPSFFYPQNPICQHILHINLLSYSFILPLGSNFPKEISSLSHSIIFLYFFALITEKGFLISPCYSLELCIQMGISFLFLSLLFFSQLFVRPPQTAVLLFCISFSWGWSCSLSPVQYHEPLSIVHLALCLSDLLP